MTSNEPKKGGTPTRAILYSEAAAHTPRAIEVIVELMENGDNDNVKLGAAKTILSKSIPDLRATEITGKEGQPFAIELVKDWLHIPREDLKPRQINEINK